jgi:hypothetical protein
MSGNTGYVAEESLIRPWREKRYPMILASSSRHSTGKLSDTGEHREVANPDKCKAIDKAGRSATVNVRNSAWSLEFGTTYF